MRVICLLLFLAATYVAGDMISEFTEHPSMAMAYGARIAIIAAALLIRVAVSSHAKPAE